MPTIKFNEFTTDKLVLTTPIENAKIPGMTKFQLLSVPMYDSDGKEEMPTVQGPWMKLFNYGLPSKNDKDGKPRLGNNGQPMTDMERGKLKIPFNLEDDDSKKFHEMLTALDKHCEETKEEIWGDKKKASAYKYQPLVRQAAVDPDADDDAPGRPDYATMKFDFDFKSRDIKTKVFVNDNGKREEMNTPTMDDVQKLIRYKCEFRPLFTICKLYATKSADTDGKRKYGLGLKLKYIEVRPMTTSAAVDTENGFLDSDDETDTKVRKDLVETTTKKVAEKVVEKVVTAPEPAEEDTKPKGRSKKASNKI